jgi:hypothetical protein
VLLAIFAAAAHAELLQFEIGRGGPYAAYAIVRVLDQSNREIFRGYADGYGRVSLSAAPGRYTLLVKTRYGDKSSVVQLSGTSASRIVTLPQ